LQYERNKDTNEFKPKYDFSLKKKEDNNNINSDNNNGNDTSEKKPVNLNR
jgi:hypothetical protein